MSSSTSTRTLSPLRPSPATPVTKSTPTFSSLPPRKRKAMSITQTYHLAHVARGKLSREAAQSDHDLRLLVGHANLLDSLMLDLAEAEKEQESWFNQTVRSATPPHHAHASTRQEERPQHIKWADEVVIEEPEEDWNVKDAATYESDSSSDSESDEEDEDVIMVDAAPNATIKATIPTFRIEVEDMEQDYDDDEEDYAQLTLTRSPSHSSASSSTASLPSPTTPDLSADDSSDDEESMPPSPPSTMLQTFSAKEAAEEEEALLSKDTGDFYDAGLYLPTRNPARLVTAVSVY